MNNESISLNIIDGIYDIQPLATPAFSPLELTLLSLFSLLVISILLYTIWRLFYSVKGIAKRKLKKTHADFLHKKLDEHDTVYQLCSVLRQGLKLNQINTDTNLPVRLNAYKQKWKLFTKTISDLRYSENKKSPAELNALFDDTLYWLKLWP